MSTSSQPLAAANGLLPTAALNGVAHLAGSAAGSSAGDLPLAAGTGPDEGPTIETEQTVYERKAAAAQAAEANALAARK